MADDTKDKDKATKPAALAAPNLSPEIEIEFGDDRNRVMSWGPTMEILRGAWSRKNLHSDELVEELAKMPDIPGIRVRVVYERKLAVVYDPLALDANKELCQTIANIIFERFRRKEGPSKESKREGMDADDLKTWLYGMRRRVDAGQARVTLGTLPTIAEIERLPGRVRIEMYNSSSRACKWREEFQEFTNLILSHARGMIPV